MLSIRLPQFSDRKPSTFCSNTPDRPGRCRRTGGLAGHDELAPIVGDEATIRSITTLGFRPRRPVRVRRCRDQVAGRAATNEIEVGLLDMMP